MGARAGEPSPRPPPVNPNVRRFLIAMLLAVLVYGGFVAWTGYRTLAQALQTFRWWTFGAALALASFNYVLRFLKWEYYLSKLGITSVPKFDSFLIFLSGFVLTITPGKIGEVFKSAVLDSIYGVDSAKTAPIVLAERLTDVVAIVVLLIIGSLGFHGGLPWALAGALAVLAGVVLVVWPPPLLYVIARLRSAGGALGRLAPQLETAQVSLRVVAHPAALLIPSAISLVGWGCEGYALSLLLRGFGEATTVPLAVFFYSTATLAGALVPVPGGLGVAEGIMQSQLIGLGGVSHGAATGSMLLIRFATLWWAVLVGFAALALLKWRHPSLLRTRGREIPGHHA